MKIIYVLHNTRSHEGSNRSFLQMLYGVISKGVDPLVILPNKSDLYILLREKGIPVRILVYKEAIYPKKNNLFQLCCFIPYLLYKIIVNYVAIFMLTRIVKQFGAQAIHTNVSVVDIGYYAAKNNNIPHFWHIREYTDLDFNTHRFLSDKKFQEILSYNNSYSICITKDISRHNNLLDNKNSCVIYNGIMSKKELMTNSLKDNYFLYAGTIFEGKGIEDLLDAFSLYCNQTPNNIYKLKIAGGGVPSYVSYIKQKYKHIIETSNVEFLGIRNDIKSLMQSATAVIVPSHFEGFGRVAAESMFCGTLVVGRNTAGTKEQFDNGVLYNNTEIGLRFETTIGLVDKLLEVSKRGHQSYLDLVRCSQNVVKELYSVESNCEQVYLFYKQHIC